MDWTMFMNNLKLLPEELSKYLLTQWIYLQNWQK